MSVAEYCVNHRQVPGKLDIHDSAGNVVVEVGIRCGVYLLLGPYQEALDHYQQALAISQQLDSTISMSQDHGNIGLCYQGLGQVDTALEHLDQAIELAVKAGMQQDEAYWLLRKGNVLIQRGRYDQGLENHRAALAIYKQLESKTELIEALHNMGHMHLLLGDSNNAESYYRQSMELARDIGLSRGITVNLLALGDLQKRQGESEVAAALYAQGVQRAKEAGEVEVWSYGLLQLAAVHRDQERARDQECCAARGLCPVHPFKDDRCWPA